MYRNYQATGNTDFAGLKATHIFSFMAAQAKAYEDGTNRQVANKELEEEYFKNESYQNLITEGEQEKYQIEVAQTVILKHWKGFIRHYLHSLAVLFFSYPPDFFTMMYSQDDRKQILEPFKEIKLKKLILGPYKAMKKGVSDRLGKLTYLINEGHWRYLMYSLFVKVFYLLNVIGCPIGFYLMIFKSKMIEDKRIGIFMAGLFGYIVLISCTWGTGRLRTQILPSMALSSSYCLYYMYLNRKVMIKKFFKIRLHSTAD